MRRAPHFTFWLSLLLALLLQMIALPEAVASARPMWVPLVLGYWALTEPRVPVLFTALLLGLAMDVLFNSVLGQNALGLILSTFLVMRLRGIFILFPLWQATLALIPVWAAYALLMFWIDGLTHHQADPWLRWLPALSTTLFWPLVFGLLDALVRRRDRED